MSSRPCSQPLPESTHLGREPGVRRCPLLRQLRGWTWLIVLASLELNTPVNAESPDRWRSHPSVGLLEGLTLRIHWFDSTEELREAAKNSGQNEIGLHGFSILKRNTQTGEYVCDLYVLDMTRAFVDGDRTTTFGHEVLHCFGLQHE